MLCSQKHESSLGIETVQARRHTIQTAVPKSMNPLWGLKRHFASCWVNVVLVPKSMNPLWGLKPAMALAQYLCGSVPKSMNPLWGLKLNLQN